MPVGSYLRDKKPRSVRGLGDKTKTGILCGLSNHGRVEIDAVLERIGGSRRNTKNVNKRKRIKKIERLLTREEK